MIWPGSATTISRFPQLDSPLAPAMALRLSNPSIRFAVCLLSRLTATPSPARRSDSFTSFASSQAFFLFLRWQIKDPSTRHSCSPGLRTNFARKILRVVLVSLSTVSVVTSADVDDVLATVNFPFGRLESLATNKAYCETSYLSRPPQQAWRKTNGAAYAAPLTTND